jgi:hypothetical protein
LSIWFPLSTASKNITPSIVRKHAEDGNSPGDGAIHGAQASTVAQEWPHSVTRNRSSDRHCEAEFRPSTRMQPMPSGGRKREGSRPTGISTGDPERRGDDIEGRSCERSAKSRNAKRLVEIRSEDNPHAYVGRRCRPARSVRDGGKNFSGLRHLTEPLAKSI